MWWALLIPCVGTIGLWLTCREKLAWWEPFCMFAPTALLITIFVFTTESMQVWDTEWCTQKCVRVEHYEPWVKEWEEWVPEQGHTDDKGNYHVDVPGHYETRTEYHPERWVKIGENGHEWGVSQGEYQRIKSEWASNGGSEVYTHLKHSDQRHRWGCASKTGIFARDSSKCNCSDGRGDMFHACWPNSHHTIESITWTQRWENRIQCAHESVFKFPDVPPERAKQLYELPNPDENCLTPCILGYGGPTQAEANKELLRQNAVLGPRSENKYERACRMWILIFPNSNSDDDARDQEALWKGGNKNEFTLCLGLGADYKANWSYIISWTPAERVKIDVRDYVMDKYADKPVDLLDIVNYMGKRCEEDFVRKRSAEWSFIKVDPPTWAIVMCWIVTLIANGGIGAWVVMNQFTEDDPTGDESGSGYHGGVRFPKRRVRF
jgi:hypothetical protein